MESSLFSGVVALRAEWSRATSAGRSGRILSGSFTSMIVRLCFPGRLQSTTRTDREIASYSNCTPPQQDAKKISFSRRESSSRWARSLRGILLFCSSSEERRCASFFMLCSTASSGSACLRFALIS